MAANVGELSIALSFDSKSLDGSIRQTEEKADRLGEKFTNTGKAIGAAFAAASAAAAVAVGKIAMDATKAFADYEQLTGGVETLFKDSADAVLEYANQAYRTAGMSANQYMETVTSFSARLLQGLGGDTTEAAKIADVAITDMADNANKMGSSMQSIQDAYQGFAKQNYTMLDNLKLGYGGTATEMARLINDSGVLGDSIEVTAKTVNDVSFDKIIEAIHVVQEDMGITGTTALEAADTISGSLNTLKAAWQDTMVGLAGGGQNFEKTLDNLVKSVGNVVKNIVPVVGKALSGIAKLVSELAPIISAELPGLIATIVPAAINAVAEIISALAQALPDIITALTSPENIQIILEAALTLFMAIVEAIPQIISALIAALPQIITGIVQFLTNPDNIGQVIAGAFQLFMGIATAIPQIIGALISALGGVLGAILQNIGGWVVDVVAKAVEVGSQFVGKVVEFFSQLPGNIANFLSQVIPNVIAWTAEMTAKAVETGTKFLENIINFFTQLPGKIWEFLTSTISKVVAFVADMGAKALEAGKMFFDNLVNKVMEIPGKMLEIGKNIVEGIWNGISGATSWLWDQIAGFCSGIVDGIKEFFGINSPSTLFRDEVGIYMAQGIGVGFSSEMNAVNEEMQSALASNMPTLATDASVSVGTDVQMGASLFSTEEERAAYLESMTAFYEELATKLNEQLSNQTNTINNWVTQTQNKVQDFITNVTNKVTQFGNQMAQKASQIGKNFHDKLLEQPKKLPDEFTQLGIDCIKGMEAGMRKQEPILMAYVESLCAKIVSRIQAAMRIHSPSGVMRDDVGVFLAQGIGVGFGEEMEKVNEDMAESIAIPEASLGDWVDTAVNLTVDDDNNNGSPDSPVTISTTNNIYNDWDWEQANEKLLEAIREVA